MIAADSLAVHLRCGKRPAIIIEVSSNTIVGRFYLKLKWVILFAGSIYTSWCLRGSRPRRRYAVVIVMNPLELDGLVSKME